LKNIIHYKILTKKKEKPIFKVILNYKRLKLSTIIELNDINCQSIWKIIFLYFIFIWNKKYIGTDG
jgi:hypothetical protein